MLWSLVELGNSLLEGSDSEDISNLILVPKVKSGKKHVIGIVEFNVEKVQVTFTLNPISGADDPREIAEKYHFVGNSKSNKPQWALTTSTLGYLLTDSIKNLVEIASSGDLRVKLENILTVFFKDVSFKDSRKGKTIDLTKLDLTNLQGIKLGSYYPNDDSVVNKTRKEYIGGLPKEISKHLLDSEQEVAFWSVYLNGDLLCSTNAKEYDQVIRKKQMGEDSLSGETGVCSICGYKGPVSYEDTKNLNFKYFITDKISFASNIDPAGFNKNLTICKSCSGKLVAAERFLKNDLQVSIGDFPVYLIPSITGGTVDKKEVQSLSKIILRSFKTLINFENLQNLEGELAKYSEYKQHAGSYVLTLLFQRREKSAASSAFKISKILEEIPDTRIHEILKTLKDASTIYNDHFNPLGKTNEYSFSLNLQKIFYHLQPSKESNVIDKKVALEIIVSVIAGKPVSEFEVMSRMVENLRGIAVRSEFNYISFCNSIAEKGIFNLFLKLDQLKANNVRRGSKMTDKVDVERDFGFETMDEAVKRATDFLREAKYSTPQKGLFWIGYLSGKLMAAQYRRLKKQPLIDKIEFKGMSKSDLIRYDNELLESMKNYDLLGKPYIQKIHYMAHGYIDRSLNDASINLTREEIPFYIMAGISYEYFTRPVKEEAQEESKEEN